ncbi:MAG TPA: RagB/SusD family nutrient uptake outer membrane protein [Puia sp.]
MKNKLIILFLLPALVSGCKKYLVEQPSGILVGNVAVSTVDGLNAQLAGAYSTVIGDWGNGFASAGPIGMSMGGDDVTTHPGLNKEEFREFDLFAVTSFNSRLLPLWNGLYKTIQSSNNIITNYSKVKGDKGSTDQIAGEAYFLRAFSYYYLVRYWGKVPLITTADYNPSLLTVSRSATTDVYKLIETDLQQAEQLVADAKVAAGRVNKGTVKAYLADVYLTESGWPLKDNSKLALAAAKAKEVIDNKAAYGFDLFQGGYGLIFAGGTVEDVFTLFTDNNTNSNHFYGMSGMPGDENGWDDYCSEINFFNNFPAGARKDAVFLTSVTVGGNTISWPNFIIHHPYYQKFKIQTGANPLDYSSASPIILMRYAEVLLLYAEAQAAGGTPNAAAYAAVNAVRERAGLADLPAGLSSADFVKAVIDERGWEFACEWHRWFDLVRTETVGTANSNRDPREVPMKGDPNNKANWLMPVPSTDASINPNLNN